MNRLPELFGFLVNANMSLALTNNMYCEIRKYQGLLRMIKHTPCNKLTIGKCCYNSTKTGNSMYSYPIRVVM